MNIKIVCRECFWIGKESELVFNVSRYHETQLCPQCLSEDLNFDINTDEFELEDEEEIYSEELDDM